MSEITLYACDLATGRVLTELPLTEFSGLRHLSGDGDMSANLALASYGEVRRRELLFATIPGRTTVVMDRDGQVAGEWIVWKRQRVNDFSPIQIAGGEMLTYAETQLMPALTYAQADQATIAGDLARYAFSPGGVSTAAGAVAITIPIPAAALTGVLRDRSYAALDGTVGQRLSELGAVNDGFDYTVESSWATLGGLRYVVRTFLLHYPKAGMVRTFTLDQAGWQAEDGRVTAGQGGVVQGISMQEDATQIASVAYAIGSGSGTTQIVGTATSVGLVTSGYPSMQISRSYTSVTNQTTINAHAAAVLDLAQHVVMPPNVTILANGVPAIGDISLGDSCQFVIDPSINFPDGYLGTVRILGWTFAPPASGMETVQLEIQGLDNLENGSS